MFYRISFGTIWRIMDNDDIHINTLARIAKQRHFIDVNNVNYTDYRVAKSRRIRKAKALIRALVLRRK